MITENKHPSFLHKISTLEDNIHTAAKEQAPTIITAGEFRQWIMIEKNLPTWVQLLTVNFPAKIRIKNNEYFIQDMAGLADYFTYGFHQFFPDERGALILSSSIIPTTKLSSNLFSFIAAATELFPFL